MEEHYRGKGWRVPVLRERGADAFGVLVSTVLSHRARDEATLRAFRQLRREFPTPEVLSAATPSKVAQLIRPVGLSESKAEGLVELSRELVTRFEGKVPSSYEDLISLPMVGPKTASAVKVFGFEHDDLPVDTHIHRVANRLGVVTTKTPEQTRARLAEAVPREYWGLLNPILVQHGQNICLAQRPRCSECPIASWCDYGNAGRTFVRDGRAPLPRSPATSRVMSANQGRGTGPEVIFRRALRAAGVSSFHSNVKGIPGRPDIAFPRQKVAVFVHGCFWHRCPHCRPPLPKTHRSFWETKFARNVERDVEKASELRRAGWKVVVVWECRLRRSTQSPVLRVVRALSRRREC